MQNVFEKIFEKLEVAGKTELIAHGGRCNGKTLALGYAKGISEAIEIVKQEAEKYNNVMIDGKYCFQSCACTEKCDKCSRLCNGDIDWYENIDDWKD